MLVTIPCDKKGRKVFYRDTVYKLIDHLVYFNGWYGIVIDVFFIDSIPWLKCESIKDGLILRLPIYAIYMNPAKGLASPAEETYYGLVLSELENDDYYYSKSKSTNPKPKRPIRVIVRLKTVNFTGYDVQPHKLVADVEPKYLFENPKHAKYKSCFRHNPRSTYKDKHNVGDHVKLRSEHEYDPEAVPW